MTHGEQAKAKKANTQASAPPKSSSQTGGKESKAVKAGSKEAGGKETGAQAGKIAVKKAGAEKSGSPAPKAVAAKEAGGNSKAGGKARPVPAADDTAPGFSNAAVAAAFKRALKKYPNAFRKLTD